MLLVIDNYDSFTYNIVHYLRELGVSDVRVARNDALDVEDIRTMAPHRILISPGPCTPDQAGISMDLVRICMGSTPILGICLGHQAIGQALGGCVVRARRVMHGKISMIHHNGLGTCKGLPNPFPATRYHSLILAWDSLPDCLEVTAWTQKEDGERDEIMGIRHRSASLEGVQFHPESIMTESGHDLLANFLDLSA